MIRVCHSRSRFFSCMYIHDKFIAGTIIAKLPPSWNNFATSLKNKRHEFSVLDLISSLDFEEKARAKDTRARVAEGASSAHMVHEKNFQPKTTRTNLRGKASLMQRTSRHILPTSRRILIRTENACSSSSTPTEIPSPPSPLALPLGSSLATLLKPVSST